jgi:hypothetical protein
MESFTTAANRGFALPGYGSAADVAVTDRRRASGVASVGGFLLATDAPVLAGAFPGTSAWSPPT